MTKPPPRPDQMLGERARGDHESVILVNPPVVGRWGEDAGGRTYLETMVGQAPRERVFSIPIEHLGLASIKAYAATRGIAVDVVNAVVAQHRDPAETWAGIVGIGARRPPVLVGFSTIVAFEQAVGLARQCKARWPEVFTVLGHDMPALNWRRILADYPEIDGVSVGDGETVLAALAERLLNGDGPEGTPGLAVRGPDGAPRLAPGTAVELDDLPWIARDELAAVHATGFSAGVSASRGCPYACAFCTTGHLAAATGRPVYRTRDVGDLAAECAALWRDHGCGFINICDDLFVLPSVASRARAHAFADALQGAGFGGRFMLDARVDSIERDLFAHLKSAGLARVFVGVETADPAQLDRMGKRYALKGRSIGAALDILVELGIEVIPGLMPLDPHVTPEHLRAVLDVMDRVRFHAPNMLLSPLLAFPGTATHAALEREGLLEESWPMGRWRYATPEAEVLVGRVAALVDRHPDDADWPALARAVGYLLDEAGPGDRPHAAE